MAESPVAVLSAERELLFYCGYALISDDLDELKYLKLFLESDAFWYFIYHTSKPYSKGFMALAKNYVVRFSIPLLKGKMKKKLLSASSREERNRIIWNSYGIDNPPQLNFSSL